MSKLLKLLAVPILATSMIFSGCGERQDNSRSGTGVKVKLLQKKN